MLESTANQTLETSESTAERPSASAKTKGDPRRLDRKSIANFLVLIIVAAAGLYLVANDRVNLWDRDEPRYAQTSRNMLQSHNWVVPMLLDVPRTAKPIFAYWCQAASMWLLGDNVNAPPTPTTVFAARLPSSVAMILVLILLAIVLYRYAGPRRALWTLLVFSTSFLVILMAKWCVTDAVLLLWTTIALLCLYAIYRGNRAWWLTIVFWIATGLGALTKGPVELAVILTTMIVLAAFDFDLNRPRLEERPTFVEAVKLFFIGIFKGSWQAAKQWWWRLRPLVGVAIVAAICVPWMVMVSQRSPGFLSTAFGHEVFDRIKEPLEQHRGPPGFYLVSIFAFFFPWSLLLPTALIIGFRQRRRPQIRFALSCIIGPWIMFECIATKLPHYLLPVYAPLAFLVAESIISLSRLEKKSLQRVIPLLAVAFWGLAVLGLCAAPWALGIRFGGIEKAGFPALIGLTLVGLLWMTSTFFRFLHRNLAGAAVSMGVGMALFVALLYAGYIPNAPYLRTPQELAQALIQRGATQPGNEIMIGYKELSTIFYQGNTLRPQRDDKYLVKEKDRNKWPTWIVMSDDVYQTMPPEVRDHLIRETFMRGWNYAGGMKPVIVWVLKTIRPM